ncbi:MAG: DUF4149 domain-containing protein [Nitrospira sp.]
MDTVLGYFHALAAAVLVGKVVLLSFVVAPVLASQLQQDLFASVVRRLFPAYYALGIGAGLAGVLSVVMLGMIREPNAARRSRRRAMRCATGWPSRHGGVPLIQYSKPRGTISIGGLCI